MPRRIEDSDDEAPAASSIENADEAASLEDLARKEPARHMTPALILRICRNAKPATQPDCVTSDEGELLSCLS
jgi:hypothetical protein